MCPACTHSYLVEIHLTLVQIGLNCVHLSLVLLHLLVLGLQLFLKPFPRTLELLSFVASSSSFRNSLACKFSRSFLSFTKSSLYTAAWMGQIPDHSTTIPGDDQCTVGWLTKAVKHKYSTGIYLTKAHHDAIHFPRLINFYLQMECCTR